MSRLICSILTVVIFINATVNGYVTLRKKAPLADPTIEWTFNVLLINEIEDFEFVGISGDNEKLGNWNPANGVLLKKTPLNVWSVTVQIPANKTINYRYFIGAIDSNGSYQIRQWETHLIPRTLAEQTENGASKMDYFGLVDRIPSQHRGWLRNETLIQFKLFRNPFKFNDNSTENNIYIKVSPVEYDLENKENLYAIIAPSAKADTEYVRMQYGDSVIRRQPEFGVQYAPNDTIIFHTTVANKTNIGYLLKIFHEDPLNQDVRHLIGYQYILPNDINGSEGQIDVQIISPIWLTTIGTARIGYVVVKPLPSPKLDLRTTFSYYWRNNWTSLDVGHRGLGKSLKTAIGAAPITENTVASMKQSVLEGADMVEFDVMLTSDLIAIIYHDYYVNICLAAKKPRSVDDLTQVLIKDLTYEQLKSLKTYQEINGKIIEYPAYNNEPRKDYRLFPLFEEFLTEIDPSIGFDIEIKWPQLKFNGKYESNQTIDKNVYVDVITEVLLTKGCGRIIFVTSFDADICTMFRFKQNLYPIAFLAPRNVEYADPRSDSFLNAVNNAQAFNLLGIAPHSSQILADPELVQLAMNIKKQVFIWGDDSSTTNAVNNFKKTGTTGVIYDRIDLLIPNNKTESIFNTDEISQLTQLQCLKQS